MIFSSTTKVADVEYVCTGFLTVDAAPSPNDHAYLSPVPVDAFENATLKPDLVKSNETKGAGGRVGFVVGVGVGAGVGTGVGRSVGRGVSLGVGVDVGAAVTATDGLGLGDGLSLESGVADGVEVPLL